MASHQRCHRLDCRDVVHQCIVGEPFSRFSMQSATFSLLGRDNNNSFFSKPTQHRKQTQYIYERKISHNTSTMSKAVYSFFNAEEINKPSPPRSSNNGSGNSSPAASPSLKRTADSGSLSDLNSSASASPGKTLMNANQSSEENKIHFADAVDMDEPASRASRSSAATERVANRTSCGAGKFVFDLITI